MLTVAETWIERPLQRFVEEARVELALLIMPSGQVLAQHGFARAVDVMSACALAAAINASGAELGRMLDGTPFRELHHAGKERQIFLAEFPAGGKSTVLVAVFDRETSLGLVRLYYEELRAELASAVRSEASGDPRLPEQFEQDLNRNLASLFGRARQR
jgi:predicted regulator of Ras-like GTPase activity (Roadblock/LC7/MglB family)